MPQDKDYQPSGSKRRKKHYRSSMSDGMPRAMDDILALSMFNQGKSSHGNFPNHKLNISHRDIERDPERRRSSVLMVVVSICAENQFILQDGSAQRTIPKAKCYEYHSDHFLRLNHILVYVE